MGGSNIFQVISKAAHPNVTQSATHSAELVHVSILSCKCQGLVCQHKQLMVPVVSKSQIRGI